MDFFGVQDTILWYKKAFKGSLLFKILIHNNQKSKENPHHPMDFKNLKRKTCEPKILNLHQIWRFMQEKETTNEGKFYSA